MVLMEVPTGEEDEETVYQLRVKLHVMEKDGGWKERGTGPLRLNVRKSDGKGARLGESAFADVNSAYDQSCELRAFCV
jgi:hypothetical protein